MQDGGSAACHASSCLPRPASEGLREHSVVRQSRLALLQPRFDSLSGNYSNGPQSELLFAVAGNASFPCNLTLPNSCGLPHLTAEVHLARTIAVPWQRGRSARQPAAP